MASPVSTVPKYRKICQCRPRFRPTLPWLWCSCTGPQRMLAYLDAARTNHRIFWSNRRGMNPCGSSLTNIPHRPPDSRHLAFFFDSGIIIRCLLAVWQETHEDRLLEVATAAAHGMSAFRSSGDYHPILTLPDKKLRCHEPRNGPPRPVAIRRSRRWPGGNWRPSPATRS